MSRPARTTIGHHVILTGYGHWLPNDPRGSGSDDTRKPELRPLGEVHHGRRRVQPTREKLKSFHKQAEPLLEQNILWFDEPHRQAIGNAFAEVIHEQRYTCWACAILRNHAHLCIRRHRDSGRQMWLRLAEASAARLRLFAEVPEDHRIWSERPYVVFLYAPEDVRRCITYIERNPQKHNLTPQRWDFVTPYDNWPLHKRKR